MSHAREIALILLRHQAVFLRPHDPFTWTSGIKAPVYCDNRLLISEVQSREIIIKSFCQKIKQLPFIDCIAGTATAGIPWAAWISQELRLPLIYVRSSSKDHGRQNSIEGKILQNSKCVLIEDLISTGKSSLAAARKLNESGIEVLKIMSIFTYGFTDVDYILQSAGATSESLTNFETLAKVALDEKMLNENELEKILNWKKSVKIL